jgi:hypothetical protein
MDFDYVSF